MLNIFKKRHNYKPFEYPEVLNFIEMINQTYWVHSEVDFAGDIQDFNTKLTPSEKEVFKRSLLSIAQIEVSVKSFWGDIYKYFPKPEFNGLGATLAESEFRHSEAYSRLLEVLGYNDEFAKSFENDVFRNRVEIASRELSTEDIFEKLLYFTIVIENSSLFSQFSNILAFTRFDGIMKNTSNIIAWTASDENIHAITGLYLLNKMIEEGYKPNYEKLKTNILEYIEYESQLLDWIYEEGELKWFSKENILNFIKWRIDDSISKIGSPKIFNITEEQYNMTWFDEEILMGEMDDFFAKRPVAYTKHSTQVTSDDLF